VDTVKIDRSFVKHAETVEYHRVLIEATIRMARALGMRTVAEGIESPGQARLMRQLLCDRGQGYLHGRPMGADELQRWVRGGVPMAAAGWAERADATSPAAGAAVAAAD
jgi:EAL domain-containing protein (putative c-di-GMP-specific phosphodiesterase class I)